MWYGRVIVLLLSKWKGQERSHGLQELINKTTEGEFQNSRCVEKVSGYSREHNTHSWITAKG